MATSHFPIGLCASGAVFFLALSLAVTAPAAGLLKITAPPPRVAITGGEAEARRNAADFPTVRAGAIAAAERHLKKAVAVPDGPGSWIFHYANPRTGTRLRPLSTTEHEDPKTGEIFRDERTLAAYRTRLHQAVERAAEALGWAYLWSGDERYAGEVRRLLLKLAHDYPGYPARLDRWGNRGSLAPWGGRRYAQSLNEATGVIPLAKAYDLTRTSAVYTPADREKIETQFFRATADTLLRFNHGIVNHQTWYNAGLMAIAGVLGDAALASRVVTMPGGYRDQLQRAVGEDGLWWEGTMAYHLYALQAMIALVEAGERYGLPLAEEPKLRRLFTAPLHLAYPDGSFPVINDSGPRHLSAFDPSWQWAWERWRDPLFAQALARGDREKLQSLLGSEASPEWPPRLTSENLADAGFAILRRNGTMVLLDYGQHGGAHGHFDKLNLTLYANGREWLPDPGRLTYSHPEYKTWVKTTAAHNTVVLDGRNQKATTGRLLALDEDETGTSLVAESSGAYPGALLRRSLYLADDFLVDCFEVQTSRPVGLVDLFIHATAESLQPISGSGSPATGAPASSAKLKGRHGYRHLTQTLEYPGHPSRWAFHTADGTRLGLHLLPDEADGKERLYTTLGIGYTVDQKTPTLVRRRSVPSGMTRFIAVYDLTGSDAGIRRIAPLPEGDPGVVIQTPDAEHTLRFTPAGITKKSTPLSVK